MCNKTNGEISYVSISVGMEVHTIIVVECSDRERVGKVQRGGKYGVESCRSAITRCSSCYFVLWRSNTRGECHVVWEFYGGVYCEYYNLKTMRLASGINCTSGSYFWPLFYTPHITPYFVYEMYRLQECSVRDQILLNPVENSLE